MNLFYHGKLLQGLNALKPRVESIARPDIKSRYDNIEESYRYMLRYLMDGYEDPHRETLFRELLLKSWHLGNDVARIERIASDNALSSLQKTLDGKDVGASSLVDALRDKSLDVKGHFEALNTAFDSVFLGNDWKEQDGRLWTGYLIDSETRSADAQVVVSAMMLSNILSFDPEKFKTLCYVYMTSEDDLVRQRALVGVVLTYRSPVAVGDDKPVFDNGDEAIKEVVGQLLADGNAVSDVISMIMQLFVCSEAEKDNRKIQNEIMPDILKGNPIRFSAKNGFVEKDDSMDDILNPGKSELDMERMEQGIQRMNDMQKAGSDIFYAGFSQMKRYPFFYRLVNWFVPFDKQHPDVTSAVPDREYLDMVEKWCNNPSFCNSDKYSFLFAFRSVLPSLPPQVRDAMSNGTAGAVGGLRIEDIEDKTAFYRRQYLQDLFRFFKLSPQVRLMDVFGFRSWFGAFMGSFAGQLSSKAIELARFLLRHGYLTEAEMSIAGIHDKEQYSLLMGALAEKKGKSGLGFYTAALDVNPDSIPALRGVARNSIGTDGSISAYDRLRTLRPDVLGYEIGYCQSRVIAGDGEAVLNDIYRLDFEHTDHPVVKRLVAWALLCLGRFDKATELYNRILAGGYGEVTSSDLLSVVDLYYISGDIRKCVEACHNYLDANPLNVDGNERYDKFAGILREEFAQLRKYVHISEVDILILVDAVFQP